MKSKETVFTITKKDIKLFAKIILIIVIVAVTYVVWRIFGSLAVITLRFVTDLISQYSLLSTTPKFFAGCLIVYVLWYILVSIISVYLKIMESFSKELSKYKIGGKSKWQS